ncbi:hypothetical protein D9C73_009566 [Collichthys lucidus]|uniref:Uncharacterized protein n=1 Tax=Collichthys lucidus TaxID=240159 RepID=A0A4V6AQL9_COLLU|nr:hypothetical protein D9C73_009566 [Collichthys lucidus]
MERLRLALLTALLWQCCRAQQRDTEVALRRMMMQTQLADEKRSTCSPYAENEKL